MELRKIPTCEKGIRMPLLAEGKGEPDGLRGLLCLEEIRMNNPLILTPLEFGFRFRLDGLRIPAS